MHERTWWAVPALVAIVAISKGSDVALPMALCAGLLAIRGYKKGPAA